MLVEIIITNGLQYTGRDLSSLTYKYCGQELDKSVRGEIITKGLSNRVLFYGADDIKYLPIIKRKQLAFVRDNNLIHAINLDNTFVIALAYVEYCGIKLNYSKWLERTARNREEAFNLKQKLEKQLLEDDKLKYFSGMLDLFTGEKDCILNWDSPKQVIELFKDYGINVILKDKGEEKETVDAKILDPQRKDFKIIPLYLDYKAMQKEISTYGESWKRFINPVTGRIHTTFQQLMDTGRLSSGNKRDGAPNLQNIPSDTETRSCFIPESGNVMIDADYSSQEQVVLANFSKEDNLLNFYVYHSFIYTEIYYLMIKL
jgi:DNA polymerase-1